MLDLFTYFSLKRTLVYGHYVHLLQGLFPINAVVISLSEVGKSAQLLGPLSDGRLELFLCVSQLLESRKGLSAGIKLAKLHSFRLAFSLARHGWHVVPSDSGHFLRGGDASHATRIDFIRLSGSLRRI